ncbi:MAG: DMT family transporter [Flavobacterium sp.]|uniref:DMT family transporter n=1 Tax=Flavobacterium sp. TaxID=239 RepID=UPI00326513D0
MNSKFLNWFLFIVLSFIWGSSFILIKEGLVSLNAYQVASLRIISSGLVLLPSAIKTFKEIPKNKIFIIFTSGALGNLIPAYLFCIAEQKIDSALAGVLNSLTPIFVIISGAIFFHISTAANKTFGIIIALMGSLLLFLSQPGFAQHSNALSVSLIVLATLSYGFNVNMVHRHLQHVPSVRIAALALSLNAVFALLVLYFTGYFKLDFSNKGILLSTFFSCVLGIFGTAVASILFYILLKRAGSIFASMVSYGIPTVAIIWGIIYGEQVGWKQVGCLAIILLGVFVANRNAIYHVEHHQKHT